MSIKRILALVLTLVSVNAFADDSDLIEMSLGDLLNMEVESASRQKESLREAPVPVTVITKEMIKQAGIRNIHEALITFVPGYTDAEDRNELNFAPRGIYATSQQKVLIMINGHRINSRSYLTAQPDYGIALHNVERIEILRGPGSSLYGNVALSGVVNLITKKGKDVNGTMVDGSFGNAGQGRLRFLHGSGSDDSDTLLWGQFYRADGTKQELKADDPHIGGAANTGDLQIDRVDDPPAHDFGITHSRGNWTFFGASRQTNWGEPYANNGASGAYEYNGFRTFRGTGPGLAIGHQHLGGKYVGELGGGWGITVNPYYDNTNIEGILATANATGTVGSQGGLMISWQDQNMGLTTTVDKGYDDFMGGKGTFLAGVQVDTFEVIDSIIMGMTGGNFNGSVGNAGVGLPDPANTPGAQLLAPGSEAIYSAFFQNKHFFSDELILNFGVRYDEKVRRTGNNRQKVSPRLAFIYLPSDNWEFKLSYSQSFVDSPYWYRYNSLVLFGGAENTDPEVLGATQGVVTYTSDDKKIKNTSVLYYQNASDLLTAQTTNPRYINSGRVESIGLENEFAYLEANWQAFWNFQYYQATSTIDYTKFDDAFAHVPQITSNLIFNYYFSKDFLTNVTVRYIGEQKYADGSADGKTVDAATIFNLGARYENLLLEGLSLDARIYNVGDSEYHQGGQTGSALPFLQAGMWYMATVGYEW